MKLNDGEIKCDKCEGTDSIDKESSTLKGVTITKFDVCNKCLGTGKLNWIEAIKGKRKTMVYFPCDGRSIDKREYPELFNSLKG